MAATDNNNGDVLYPYVQQPKTHQQQVEWNTYLQQLRLQQWEELEQQIEMQREVMRWEVELRRLVSFLEKDYSFFSPWNWNPNNNAPATSGEMMRFEPGSFFSEDNLEYSREHAKSGDISRMDAKLVSEDSSTDQKPLRPGVKQGSSGFDVKQVADQNAEGTSKGFDVKQVADRNPKGRGVEEEEDSDEYEYEVEQLTSGTVTKMDRCRKFERNAKGKRGKCKH